VALADLATRSEIKQLYTWGGNDPLIETFLSNDVQFLVVGGLAMYFHDKSRKPDDLDLMVRQTPANAEKIEVALYQAGLCTGSLVTEFMRPKPQQISLKHLPPNYYYVDIITPGPNVNAEGDWDNGQLARLNRFTVPIATVALLLRMKSGSDQEKDQDDVRRLQALARSDLDVKTAP
jgi:hypothetical protein